MSELISIRQAAAQGICRLRLPQWVNKLEHLKIDIIDGEPGPWAHLYSPSNISINGRDPVDITVFESINALHVDTYEVVYEPHTGPTHESQEYKDEQARWLADDRRLRGDA